MATLLDPTGIAQKLPKVDMRPLLEVLHQKSPIFLQGGWVSSVGIPGGILPIVALTEAKNLTVNLLTGKALSLGGMAADFMVKPGGTMQRNEIAEYPFASQYTAANAVLAKPNTVTVSMIWPMRQIGSGVTKTAEMMVFQSLLDKHRDLGGTYIVVTPALIYSGCVITTITDATPSSNGGQQQYVWDISFTQPLTADDGTNGSALNKFYTKLQAGARI